MKEERKTVNKEMENKTQKGKRKRKDGRKEGKGERKGRKGRRKEISLMWLEIAFYIKYIKYFIANISVSVI